MHGLKASYALIDSSQMKQKLQLFRALLDLKKLVL